MNAMQLNRQEFIIQMAQKIIENQLQAIGSWGSQANNIRTREQFSDLAFEVSKAYAKDLSNV